jgi:hypothetical protein
MCYDAFKEPVANYCDSLKVVRYMHDDSLRMVAQERLK